MLEFTMKFSQNSKSFTIYSATHAGTLLGLQYLKDLCGKESFTAGAPEYFPGQTEENKWGIRVIPNNKE